MTKTPKLRFPGFTDAWEQRKLGEVGFAKSGTGFPDAEQGGMEGIPFFKVSDMNIKGNENNLVVANNYVTDEQIRRKKWNVIDDVPAIFFAKVGAAVMLNRKRLVRLPFLLDNNTMAYIFDKSLWDCDFGKTIFETINLTKLTQVGALPSYNASDVEAIKIYLPQREEQSAIGTFFRQLDELLTLHQRKLDEVKNLKKSLLQKMFPKNGERIPEVRFPEFIDAWEQRKLGEEVTFYNGRAYKQSELLDKGKYRVVRVGNFNTNDRWYYSDLELEENKFIDCGDLLYLWATSFGPEIWKYDKAIYHYHIWKLVIKNFDKINKYYLYTWLLQDKERISQNTNGTTMVHVTKGMIEERVFDFPPLPEQEAIGTFFRQLDELLTLHQRKLEHLQSLKKALLQQMFV
ncbi:restriction endonuclease subunit S [Streptococcus mutans]|nr:restriction endonuclease subunit S [Streptococcus mutans]